MGAYTQGQLRAEAAFSIMNIKEFHMEIEKGLHSHIYLKGEIPQEEGKSALLQGLNHTDLKILLIDEPVFIGVIQEAEITHDGEGYQLTLHGSSKTVVLDDGRKSRTFQDVHKTYKQIMQEVLADREAAGLKFYAADREINNPVYQIEETDWEFIKRMASQLKAPVLPVCLTSSAVISVGLPEGKLQDMESGTVCERIWYDREKNSICRSIRGYENRNPGDRLTWEGKNYTIIQKSCRLEQGLLYFRYLIIRKEAYTAERYENPHIAGLLLSAAVLDTRKEEVKVKFDIDKQQAKENAYWYPWEPDVGNIMYCMPEIGETVYMNFGDPAGEKVRAVCGVHKNGAGNPEMKTTHRYFTTAEKKRMYATPDTLGFKDLKQSSPLEILLNDSTGASVRSSRKLVVTARDTIGIKADHIFLQAPKEVSLVRRDNASPAVINMCNGFDSVGATNEVTASGGGEDYFPVFHETEQEAGREYSLAGVESAVLASTPGRGLSGNLERQIQGIRVDRAAGEAENGQQIKEGDV